MIFDHIVYSQKKRKTRLNIFTLGKGVLHVLMDIFSNFLFPNLVNDGEEKEDTVKGAKYA